MLTATECELLHEAGRTADELARIDAALEGAPMTVAGSKGQDVAHPLLNEARQHRLVLTRLVAALSLPDLDTFTMRRQSPASRHAQHAAESRWAMEGARRGTPRS
jgi:hypothetical protein